jgi:hypothetical protein
MGFLMDIELPVRIPYSPLTHQPPPTPSLSVRSRPLRFPPHSTTPLPTPLRPVFRSPLFLSLFTCHKGSRSLKDFDYSVSFNCREGAGRPYAKSSLQTYVRNHLHMRTTRRVCECGEGGDATPHSPFPSSHTLYSQLIPGAKTTLHWSPSSSMHLPHLGCAGGERRYCSREESGEWRVEKEDIG